jgi:glutathione S-transferase
VPLLMVRADDGRETVLFESAVICEYLDETAPGPRLHLADPLERARARGWIEFGSAILADIWGLETAQEAADFEAKRAALAAKFATVEAAAAGPFFACARFILVDAVFGPIFRYFDVFDALADTGVFASTPKLRAWRATLADRPSVRDAVAPDYPDRLRAFLTRHDAWLLRLPAVAPDRTHPRPCPPARALTFPGSVHDRCISCACVVHKVCI